MVVADLHVHTINSDGSLTLAELPEVARAAGLDAVAVTDHDRLHPALDEPITTREGVEVIHGIELRVDVGAFKVDLLGYGVTDPTPLASLVKDLQANRIERARAIVECVEDRLDVELDVAFESGTGRPHIARAIAKTSTEYTYQDAFDELIGSDGPCYVARDIPSYESGRQRLAESCGLVSLAHPLRYPEPERAFELLDDLDAVELEYPYGDDQDTAVVERAAREHDVLVTGGSDAHDRVLGVAGLDQAAYEAVKAHLQGD